MTDSAPKSAVELAMERLRQKDQAEGVETKPLTEDQKTAIAEARNLCDARLAEREILYHSKLMTTFDPAERATLEDEYRRDRERYITDRDAKLRRIRESG